MDDHDHQNHDDDSITLSDALKLSGLVDTGGQAKQMIQNGEVRVNGEIETRRKRRLHQGDEIEVGGESFVLELYSEEDLEGEEIEEIEDDEDEDDDGDDGDDEEHERS